MPKVKIAPELVPELVRLGVAALAASSAPSATAYPPSWQEPRARVVQAGANTSPPAGTARGAATPTPTPTDYPDAWRPRRAQARGGGEVGARPRLVATSSATAATGDVSRDCSRIVHVAGRTPQLLADQREAERERIRATQGDRTYMRNGCQPSSTAQDQVAREHTEWRRMAAAQAALAQASGAR
jgi:hypothetical protein